VPHCDDLQRCSVLPVSVQVQVALHLMVHRRSRLTTASRGLWSEVVLGTRAEACHAPSDAASREHLFGAIRPAACGGDHLWEGVIGKNLSEGGANCDGGEDASRNRAADAARVDLIALELCSDLLREFSPHPVGGAREAASDRFPDDQKIWLK